MRINITVELTEDFKNFLITHGQRAAWVWVAGVLSAALVGFMLLFPGAGATVVCLLLVGLFGYGLRVIYAPATFPNTERATLYSKIDTMLRENTELRRDIDMKHAENEHNAAVFRLAMDAKDVEYRAAMDEQARKATTDAAKVFTHTVDEVNAAVDKILAATGRAPYAMDAAENGINPAKGWTAEDQLNMELGLNPATAHLATPAPKPKRVRKPTPSQARKLREAGKDG